MTNINAQLCGAFVCNNIGTPSQSTERSIRWRKANVSAAAFNVTVVFILTAIDFATLSNYFTDIWEIKTRQTLEKSCFISIPEVAQKI